MFVCVGSDPPEDSLLVYRPDQRLQLWRFLSYALLHASWRHLGFNVLTQLLFGLPLELVHGSLRTGIIYMAGVLAGSLGTSVVDSEVYLVGASGGVYALLAAQLASLLLNFGQMRHGVVQLMAVIVFGELATLGERYHGGKSLNFSQFNWICNFSPLLPSFLRSGLCVLHPRTGGSASADSTLGLVHRPHDRSSGWDQCGPVAPAAAGWRTASTSPPLAGPGCVVLVQCLRDRLQPGQHGHSPAAGRGGGPGDPAAPDARPRNGLRSCPRLHPLSALRL